MCDISRTFNMATFNCKGGSKTEFISLKVYVEETGMSFKETNSSI